MTKLKDDLEILDALRVQMQEQWPAFPPEGIYSALNTGIAAIKILIKQLDAADHRVDL